MKTKSIIFAVAGLSNLVTVPALYAENRIVLHGARYLEGDQRIDVSLGGLEVEHDFGLDYTGRFNIEFDTISGATPMWQPAPGYQNEYTSGTVKLADETRYSLGGGLTIRDSKRNEYTLGVSWSEEPDFTSAGLSAQAMLWHDDAHNRSYTVGGSLLYNTAVGTQYTNNHQDKESTMVSFQAGINQVLDSTSTIEGSLYLNRDDGYLSNHYLKIVRQDVNFQHYLADDSRPNNRTAGGLALRWVKAWRPDLTTNAWYRLYQDDWGITGNTAELSVQWDVGGPFRLNPVIRVHHQTAADFYRGYGDSPNTFAATGLGSNDARLGQFYARTLQINGEYALNNDFSINAGYSNYRQDNGFNAEWYTLGAVYHY